MENKDYVIFSVHGYGSGYLCYVDRQRYERTTKIENADKFSKTEAENKVKILRHPCCFVYDTTSGTKLLKSFNEFVEKKIGIFFLKQKMSIALFIKLSYRIAFYYSRNRYKTNLSLFGFGLAFRVKNKIKGTAAEKFGGCPSFRFLKWQVILLKNNLII
jgi:hypothetical protein